METDRVIVVHRHLYGEDAAAKTQAANEVAKRFGISDEALEKVEDFKNELTYHKAWDLPFFGYVNEDGEGFAYVPDYAIADDKWDAHKAFRDLPIDVQTAFAIRMLFTHRDVDRYGARMFLHYDRGLIVQHDSL